MPLLKSRGGKHDARYPGGRDCLKVGEQHAVVVEEDHAVAEQAPALFWVCRDDASSSPAGSVGRGAGWLVLAHDGHLLAGDRSRFAAPFCRLPTDTWKRLAYPRWIHPQWLKLRGRSPCSKCGPAHDGLKATR